MSAKRVENISCYVDRQALERDEPGIVHSYMAGLSTAINHLAGELDPAWLMGSSAFAFRLFINQIMCPSAMSIFNWADLLPEAVEQAGYKCAYVSRMWNENETEEQRRREAHAAIVDGIDRGAPAIAWDVAHCEWGTITGYDEDAQAYHALTNEGRPITLAYDRLGHNGIDVLSVAIPGEANGRSREESIHNSLKVAVAHAECEEWTERPEYENGLKGYDMWASAFDKWALLVVAGKADNIGFDILAHSVYYAGHHYSSRCYARDYLREIADGHETLQRASDSYGVAASHLKQTWDCLRSEESRGTIVLERLRRKQSPSQEELDSLAESIRAARDAEREAIDSIKRYLEQQHVR
jgi:hypothetical protein